MPSRDIRSTVLFLLFTAHLLLGYFAPESGIREWTSWALVIGVVIHFALAFRTGYLRHRGHWTRESWRRYLIACSIPGLLLAMLIGLIFAIDAKWPMFGASRTSLRSAWAIVAVFLILTGGLGLSIIKNRLERGDPSRQFEWPRWMRRSST